MEKCARVKGVATLDLSLQFEEYICQSVALTRKLGMQRSLL